jgi:2-dehydro-3-deoxyphosphogluconate aldolase / (4S)-4-hydroxy-2-oxoglutarate aldolase
MMKNKDYREIIVILTKKVGVIPCIKLHKKSDGNYLELMQAMYDGGARIVEITMTSPGVLETIKEVSAKFGDKLYVAVGTVLEPDTAKKVIQLGAKLIVSPTVNPKVIKTAVHYNIPCYSGAFTATECKLALDSGATMVKIFPAHIGGPKYIANLKMILPDADFVPSGGINIDNAAEYIKYGAFAVSANRDFMNFEKLKQPDGMEWLSKKMADFINVIKEARKNVLPPP